MPSRISLAKCRQLLGSPDLPDADIEKLRDELYLLSEVIVDSWCRSRSKHDDPDFVDHTVQPLPLNEADQADATAAALIGLRSLQPNVDHEVGSQHA